eukprot:GFUD01069821.1.p1 GENE.GFUD01069821.1~~GFUD01069821.1.p1  ORF type:complete len:104 (-),score=34.12 GFUD01069821.1:63-374(-)
MEEPIMQPEAPPPYEGPDARAEITELTWAEQVALNETAALETYQPKAFDIPEAVAVADEPADVAEMKVMISPVRVQVKNSAGKMIAAFWARWCCHGYNCCSFC